MAALDANWENAKTTELSFAIATPPWFSWWAYVAYIAVILALIYIFFHYYTILIKRNKERELDQLKMKSFMNVSHEFRTPLTLILNPVDKIISRYNEPDEVQKSALTIQRSARKLLSLTNQLLDFRKIEMGDPLRLNNIDLVLLSKNIYNLFKDLATDKGIDLHFSSAYEHFNMDVDVDKYEKILTNLLSNALKFTHKGGKISLSIEQTFINRYRKSGRIGFKNQEYIEVTSKNPIFLEQNPFLDFFFKYPVFLFLRFHRY